ncbi:quinate transport protein [Alternaria alternata]|nr:quinate transport protein [Alternaria alternata]
MLGSVLLPTKPPGLRKHNTYSSTVAPPLPPRRNSLSTTPAAKTAAKSAPLHVKTVTLSGGMDTRYNRPSSPRGSRYSNPARSSTGTFSDPYYSSSYSSYGRPSSPRSSVDRLGTSHTSHTSHHTPYYTPTTSHTSHSTTAKYDSYTGRPRRNTNDLSRPNVSTSALPQTSLPLRTPYSTHTHTDRPRSPLTPSYAKGPDTYITPGASSRGHKKVYSVDDTSHLTKLVAEVQPSSHHHRDHADRGYSLTSGGRSYHDSSKPPSRLTDLSNSDGYSYTDPASMYRDTEPAWRRPRAGSLERSSRPTSMISDRPARASTRELGPPPSTRGFDKINSIPRPHGRSSSIERARDIPKYDPYPDTSLGRSSSTRNSRTPAAIHQEPRRDTYRDDYDRQSRGVENKRHSTAFEDREVTTRGFGIAPGPPALAHDHHTLDRQPLYPPAEPPRPRPQEPSSHYYQPERAEARMPDPRASRDRDIAPPQDYDKRPRERERERESRSEEKGSFVQTAAGAVAGVAATLAGAGYMKNRDKDRGSDRDSSGERERERRKEYDERDRRDRPDERRERKSEGRRNSLQPQQPPPAAVPVPVPAPAPAPAPAQIAAPDYPPIEPERKLRERRYEDDDREKVPLVPSRKPPSSEGSGDERPRHYVDRDAERRREPAPQEATLDPDEEYRRRVQQEAERASRSTRDRDSDSDREKSRRSKKDERDRSRGPEDRSRASPPRDRPMSVYDGGMVQEPETLDRESTSKSVQIVEPPKEPVAPVKGILRKPTEKFPEDPEPIREGVAPHKDALKGKDIPVGARWTRIDRRLVNPEALEQAKERFEERMDCVIVLRVLTKEEIQKLADRTKKIRESREEEYDHDRRDRDDRDRRSHRSKDDRDDEDRDSDRDRDRRHHDRERRRRYDDESDYDDRERERERDRPRKVEIDDGR